MALSYFLGPKSLLDQGQLEVEAIRDIHNDRQVDIWLDKWAESWKLGKYTLMSWCIQLINISEIYMGGYL